jgi:hypothetical protein
MTVRIYQEEKAVKSHSKSIPSRSYFCTICRTVCTNAVRLVAELTAVEKNRDPDQPPMVRIAATFWQSEPSAYVMWMGKVSSTYMLMGKLNKLRQEPLVRILQ